MAKKLLCYILAVMLCSSALHFSAFGASTVPNLTGMLDGITAKNGGKIKIACIGSSTTYGSGADPASTYSWPAQLQKLLGDKYEVGNFGKPGSYVLAADNKYNANKTAQNSYKNTVEYKNSIAFEPDVVMIMLGTNDATSMSCPEAVEEFRAAFKALALEYSRLESVQKVIITTMSQQPASPERVQFNDGPLQAVQKQVAEELGFDFIDVWAMAHDYFNVMMHYTKDQIHPTNESYGEIARALYCALVGEEYIATIPEKSATGVVYVKTGGKATGNGDSPENAVDNIAKAAGLLRESGGTIVICGPYTLAYDTHLPDTRGKITITSTYDGVNYTESAGAYLGMTTTLYFYGEYVLEDLHIKAEKDNSFFICNYNDTVFGDNIVCTLSSGATIYPLILIGVNARVGGAPAEKLCLLDECNITVNSGTWAYIRSGNRRGSGSYPVATVAKDAKLTVTINGGTFANTNEKNNLVAATGQNSVEGECNLIINGGTFNGNVYAVSRVGTNTTQTSPEMSGKVNLVVNGGEFAEKIICRQDNTTKITGEVSLTITPALAAKAEGFTDVTVREKASEIPPAEKTELKMTVGKTQYILNGEQKTMDVAPIIRNERTMLPVRYVAEALGAAIAWDGDTSTATLTTADTEIKITVGATTATVNGQAVTLDSPAFLENDRTYMPVRFVAETLGATVSWDGVTSTATIRK